MTTHRVDSNCMTTHRVDSNCVTTHKVDSNCMTTHKVDSNCMTTDQVDSNFMSTHSTPTCFGESVIRVGLHKIPGELSHLTFSHTGSVDANIIREAKHYRIISY